MCTSLTYTNGAGHHFFARTMDFPTTTPWRPIFLPRHHRWHTALKTVRTTRYAFLGGGRLSTRQTILMADGVNERGLTCAELYLPGAVTYADTPAADGINLTPQDFINWVLGEHASLHDVVADLPQVHLINRRWGDEVYVYPFHWILSDATGQTLVIEPTELTLHAQPDPSGVLTNTPVLATHLHNLNQFLHVPGDNFTPATIRAAQHYLARQAALPTGTVPTQRFIYTAIQRWGTPLLPTTHATLRQIFNWLAAVSLPYQSKRRYERNHNYTHYRAIIDLAQKSYTFIPRTTQRVQQIRLTPQMAASRNSPHVYSAN